MAWPLFLFLTALVVPWIIYIGPLRMSVYRFVLVAMVLPCLYMLFAGRAGRIRIADVALMLFCCWSTLSFVANNGTDALLQPSGIVSIETLGPYLLARCYVRNADQFRAVVRLLFRLVVALSPFAVYEFIFGQNILRELFAVLFPTLTTSMPPRFGLTRVQTVFDHPILFGVFSGSILAVVHLVLGFRSSILQRCSRMALVAGMTLVSMSAGPLIALVTQGALLAWNGSLRAVELRWKVLLGVSVLLFLTIELAANRSALDVIIGGFLFDPGSYWYRLLIWTHGVTSVFNHPLLGIGLSEWVRPSWMGYSIDNFWLFTTVRHGFPAILFLLLTFFSIFIAVAFKTGLDAELVEYRTGFLITMAALFFVGWTVALWDAVYVLFMFLMGSGVWMLDVTPEGAGDSQAKTRRLTGPMRVAECSGARGVASERTAQSRRAIAPRSEITAAAEGRRSRCIAAEGDGCA